MNMNKRNGKAQSGFTLIELMIVVAIIGVISVIAVPSYTDYVVRAKRSLAQQTLLEIASRQEQYMLDNKTYADSLEDLGYPGFFFASNSNGEELEFLDSSEQDVDYVYALWTAETTSSGTVLAWDVYAFPWYAQGTRDTKCGRLRLDEDGAQDAAYGTSEKCW